MAPVLFLNRAGTEVMFQGCPEAQVPWAAPTLHPSASLSRGRILVVPWGLQTCPWVGSGPSLFSKSSRGEGGGRGRCQRRPEQEEGPMFQLIQLVPGKSKSWARSLLGVSTSCGLRRVFYPLPRESPPIKWR